MPTPRQLRIDELRQRQPIEELERKWKKIEGSRHARHVWTQEWLDLAHKRAEELHAQLRPYIE